MLFLNAKTYDAIFVWIVAFEMFAFEKEITFTSTKF